MKLAITLSLLTAAIGAQAQTPAFTDRARVQSVEPQYETVQVPREECRTDWVTEAQPRQYETRGNAGVGGAVLGGVTGGLLGAQVGKGSGRDAAIAAGVVIGAVAGNNIASHSNVVTAPTYEQREVRSCRTVSDVQNRLVGYRVTLEYRGHTYTTMTREQPGSTMPVRVSVTPIDEAEYHRPF